jgi:hypothetical protein
VAVPGVREWAACDTGEESEEAMMRDKEICRAELHRDKALARGEVVPLYGWVHLDVVDVRDEHRALILEENLRRAGRIVR